MHIGDLLIYLFVISFVIIVFLYLYVGEEDDKRLTLMKVHVKVKKFEQYGLSCMYLSGPQVDISRFITFLTKKEYRAIKDKILKGKDEDNIDYFDLKLQLKLYANITL